MKILLCRLAFLVLFCSGLQAADPVFYDGEELVYKASWTGVPAGEIRMKTSEKKNGRFNFEMKAKTNSFWSLVFKVRDTVKSQVSLEPFRSHRYYKDTRHGRRHLEEIITMDYEAGVVHKSKQNHSAKEKARKKDFPMPEGTQALCDPLSMIYAIRELDFQNPRSLNTPFNVFASKGTYDINFKLVKELELEDPIFGNRKVWRLEPSAEVDGALVTKGRLEMWVDRQSGIPLKIVFHIPVGWASLELTESNHPKLKSVSGKRRRRR